MGGRALEVYGAQRVDKTLYITLRKEVLQHLGAMCPDYHGFVEIPSYGAKSTFGDLDILYTNPYPDMRQDLIEAFPGPHFGIPPHIDLHTLTFQMRLQLDQSDVYNQFDFPLPLMKRIFQQDHY